MMTIFVIFANFWREKNWRFSSNYDFFSAYLNSSNLSQTYQYFRGENILQIITMTPRSSRPALF
jgi:hypothetical protein